MAPTSPTHPTSLTSQHALEEAPELRWWTKRDKIEALEATASPFVDVGHNDMISPFIALFSEKEGIWTTHPPARV